MSPLVSPKFGPIDPLDPRAPARLGGGVVVAEPVLIQASAQIVWDVVVGFDAYPEWNPLNRHFACAGGVGAPATFGVSWGPYDGGLREPTLTMREVVTVWEPGRCFAYADDRGRMHCAERVQVLTETDDGTRYQTWERWAGWLTPLVGALYDARIRAGFRAASLATKARAERLARTTERD